MRGERKNEKKELYGRRLTKNRVRGVDKKGTWGLYFLIYRH